MKNLTFLCVILLSACASGLDVKASKSDDIFHLHHLNNKNESKPVKFSLLQQLSLTTSSKQIPSQQLPVSSLITKSLNENICHCVKHGLIIWSSCADVNSHNKVVVCYVNGLAANNPGNGTFLVEKIDPMLCTHIIYEFAGLDNVTHSIYSLDSYIDTEEDGGKGK